jgi:hypothetical protein
MVFDKDNILGTVLIREQLAVFLKWLEMLFAMVRRKARQLCRRSKKR